jgi:hypothetical protein
MGFIACSLVKNKKSQDVVARFGMDEKVFYFILTIESVKSVSFYSKLALPSMCYLWKLPDSDCYLPVSGLPS